MENPWSSLKGKVGRAQFAGPILAPSAPGAPPRADTHALVRVEAIDEDGTILLRHLETLSEGGKKVHFTVRIPGSAMVAFLEVAEETASLHLIGS